MGNFLVSNIFQHNMFAGILEKEEEEDDDPNDEVLAELRKKQQELRAISQQNVNILKSLYRQGQEDMARQDLRKKLQAADSEVNK